MAPHSRKTIGQENSGISSIPRKMDRATSKPLMEKRRRERINKSLSELKNILLEALKRDQSSCSKLEKADILEMTVKYLNQTKMMTGSYPSPYQTGSQTGSGFSSGYNRAQEECIKMIRENPALTEAQKIQMINQMTAKQATMQAAISPQKVARSPLLPLATGNQSVINQQQAMNHPANQAAIQYFQQLQHQQYLMSLQQQTINQTTPTVQPIRRSNSPAHVGSTGQSDSESESGSQTSSNSEIFRPW